MLARWNECLKRYPYVTEAVLVLVPCAVFAGVLANGFVYDDGRKVLENPFVRNSRLWTQIFTRSDWSFMGSAVLENYYRPLHIFSYWAIYRLAGADPGVFHLFQWLLHAAAVFVVFHIGRALLENDLAAFAGALLWALHPLHVEAVAWIAALSDVGCGFFCLLAFLLFVRAEKAGRSRALHHALAALVYLLALFFKEMALSFPALLVAYGLLIPAEDSPLRRMGRWLPYAGAAGIYVGARVAVLGRFSDAPPFWKVSPRVLGAALGLLGQHTRLFFWPTHLNVFRTFDLGPSLRSPWPWITLVALLAALALRRREPVLSFLVIWWPVTLLPCLDVRLLSVPLLAERFSYLPSVGLCLAIAGAGVAWVAQRAPTWKLAPAAVPTLLVSVGFFWTFQDLRATSNWRNNDTLFDYSSQASPNAGLVHVHRGLQLQLRYGDPDGAVREYEAALQMNKASFVPLPGVTYDSYIGLGQIAYGKGDEQEALGYLERAVRVLPYQSLAYDVLGSIYFPRANYVKAAEYFSHAVQVNPYDLSARFYLGTCWVKMNRYRDAAAQFRAAREADPSYFQAFEAEARALEATGDAAEAARVRGLKAEAE